MGNNGCTYHIQRALFARWVSVPPTIGVSIAVGPADVVRTRPRGATGLGPVVAYTSFLWAAGTLLRATMNRSSELSIFAGGRRERRLGWSMYDAVWRRPYRYCKVLSPSMNSRRPSRPVSQKVAAMNPVRRRTLPSQETSFLWPSS